MGKQWMTMAVALLAGVTALPALAAVQMQIRDRDTGRVLTQYADGPRQWIAGEPGHRYAIELYNASHERVLAVLSVDGVNVISGQTASTDQGGYVLDPWERISIDGWRKSLHNVASFEFTELPDSYAARTGRPGNVGVIGVAVFGEKRPLRWSEPEPRSPQMQAPGRGYDDEAGTLEKRSQSAPSASGRSSADALAEEQANRQYLGTGHGQQQWSPARQTRFERASSRPQQIAEIYYDDSTRLVAMGILPPPYPQYGSNRPQAFPGFVPDPPATQYPRHPRPRGWIGRR